MKLNWLQYNREERQQVKLNQESFLNGSLIRPDKSRGSLRWPDKGPTPEAMRICDAVRSGNIEKYLELLRKMPEKKIIGKFLGIIYSKSSRLPVLGEEEKPCVVIEGTSFDPIQNVLARMMTKTTLLLIIESESKKLGIWNCIQSPWMEKYIFETKMYVQIIEAIAKQCENDGQQDKSSELRNSIKLIKEANTQYAIDW
jgi:hypothetical protein